MKWKKIIDKNLQEDKLYNFKKGSLQQLGYRNYDNLDDQTKNAIAKISVLEHRFKYALANAFKRRG